MTTLLSLPGQALRGALRAVRPGKSSLETARLGLDFTIAVHSDAFMTGRPMPARFTADGAGRMPPVAWSGLPDGTASVVLLVQDADPPLPRPLTHLIVYGIPPDVDSLAEGEIPRRLVGPGRHGYACGRNAAWRTGWLPPSPPPGHGAHRYAFQVFALDANPDFTRPPGRAALMRAIRPHILAQGRLIGRYER